MRKVETAPLADRAVPARTAEYWAWAVAHRENYLARLRSQDDDQGKLPQVIHLHRHGEPCNAECVVAYEAT